MMNKLVQFLSVSAMALTACTGGENFLVEGKFEHAVGKTLVFQRIDLKGTVNVDSVQLKKDGSFSFEGSRLTEPTFFQLTLPGNQFITLLVDSTEKVSVEGDLSRFDQSVRVSRSVGAQQLFELKSRASKLQSSLQKLLGKVNALPSADLEGRQYIQRQIDREIAEYKQEVDVFIFEHPRSFVSYYALFQNILNMPVMDVMDAHDQILFATVATSLNLMYPENERVKHLYQYVLGAKQIQQRQKMNEALLQSVPQVSIPEIEEKDVHGNIVKLSELKGKVVLLSFWAAWDEASVKENRNLVKQYQKYKGKGFEIFQVSLDKSKVLWESTIRRDQLDWIHVSDLQYTHSYWARLYNIKSIPSNFLIDRNGELIGKDLFGSRLDEKLAGFLR